MLVFTKIFIAFFPSFLVCFYLSQLAWQKTVLLCEFFERRLACLELFFELFPSHLDQSLNIFALDSKFLKLQVYDLSNSLNKFNPLTKFFHQTVNIVLSNLPQIDCLGRSPIRPQDSWIFITKREGLAVMRRLGSEREIEFLWEMTCDASLNAGEGISSCYCILYNLFFQLWTWFYLFFVFCLKNFK